MSLEPSILSNMDDETKDFIESLMSLNKSFYERLREYTINVIGSGNLGIPYVLHMASLIAKPNSKIRKINWITREYKDRYGDLKTAKLDKIIDDEFGKNLSDRQGRNAQIYEAIKNGVNIQGYTNISELKEIIRSSVNPDTKKYGNLSIILTDYDIKFLFNEFKGKNPQQKILIAKTRQELKSLSESEIMLNARTLSYKNLQGFNECIESLIETQQRIDTIRKTVSTFCNEAGIEPDRYALLPQSLIGNMAIAKAFEGYSGTVINMTNPVEAITQQFAFHSKMPPNRIFASIENDYCRLNLIIRNIYHETFSERFNGKLVVPQIYGQHNELMESDRSEIFFGEIAFDNTFKNHDASAIFDKIKRNWRNYGSVHKLKYGVVCPDTVPNSLIPATIMIVNEQNSEVMRGCIYNKDYGIFTGGDFRLQRGHVIPESLGSIETLPADIRKNVNKGIALDHKLTEELSKIDGLTGLTLEKPAKIPKVIPLPKLSAEEFICKVVDKRLKDNNISKTEEAVTDNISDIDFTVLFKSSTDARKINQYKFSKSDSPIIKPYNLMILGSDAINTSHELQRTKIKSFSIKDDRLIMLAVRQYKDLSKTFYINEYDLNNGNVPSYSKHFDFKKDEGIKAMAINDNTYLLMKDSRGQYVALFDGGITEICRVPKELSSIIPYDTSILGYNDKEYYRLDKRMELIHKSKKSNNGRVLADSINNTIYYVVYDDNILRNYPEVSDFTIKKDIVAQSLGDGRYKVFQSDPNGFDIYSDDQGIQIWTTLDNKIILSSPSDKDMLFEKNNPGSNTTLSNYINLKKHYLQAIRRDMAILHHEEKVKLLRVYDNTISIVPLKLLDDCQPNGVFL